MTVTKQDIQIAGIREEHIEGFRHCLDVVAKEGKYLSISQAASSENIKRFVCNNIANEEIQLVALSHSEVIGWIDILRGTLDSNIHCGRLGMGILPEWRGKGIGKLLMQAALEKANQTTLQIVQLDVFESNTNAIKLYESFGFMREGLRVDARFVDGCYINDVPMARRLSKDAT